MATWRSYSVLPFPSGGAGRVRVVLDSAVDEVVALVGLAAAPAQDSAGHLRVSLAVQDNGLEWRGNFHGAVRSPVSVISFFYRIGAAWTLGPVVGPVPLVWAYSSIDFPWIKRWVVDRLQEIAAQIDPLGAAKPVKVSGAFPRDTSAFPLVTVQVDSAAPALESVGRTLGKDRSGNVLRGTQYNLSLSIVAWAPTPEDRDDLAIWLGQASEVLIQLLPTIECLEPSVSLEESEDFQTLDVPTFLCTARLNTSRWSLHVTPTLNEFGLLTI